MKVDARDNGQSLNDEKWTRVPLCGDVDMYYTCNMKASQEKRFKHDGENYLTLGWYIN